MTAKPSDPYVSDIAVADREGDLLRRWPFAARIADTLATRSDSASLVVGVYGRWGEGKTTVLEFIERRLRGHENVVTVRFNPWLFRSDDELFTGFFAELATAIESRLDSPGNRVGEFLKTYGGIVAGLGVDLSKPGEAFARTTPQQLRERLEQALEEKKKRVVILLDDIDRLDKDAVQAVFRLIKVAADFRWTSYVLALDHDIVAAALAERYPGRAEAGADFLEKIIQVPLWLPPAPRGVLQKLLFQDVDRALKDAAIELSEREARRFATEFDLRLMHRVGTPRAAKRYVNALQFVLPLLRGEVDVVDLLLVVAIQVFHPKLHAVILRNRDAVLHGGDRRSNERAEALKADIAAVVDTVSLSGAARGRAEIDLLEELFPRVKSIYSNTFYGSDWDSTWAKDKKVASERYFPRYFSSGVPIGDVPDALAAEVVATAAGNAPGAADAVRTMLAQADPDQLVQKLIDVAWNLEGDAAVGAARALIEVGQDFPHSADGFGEYFAPRGRAALLAARLVTRCPAPRDASIADVLSYGALPFALQVFRRLQPAESHRGDAHAATGLTDVEWRALGRRIADRVKAQAEGHWLLGMADGPFRLAVWRELGDPAELRAYIEESLADDPRRAIDLVRCHCVSSVSMTSGERYLEPLHPEKLHRVAELVDTGTLATLLTNSYGPPSASLDGRYVKDDAELAHSFLKLHAAASSTPTGSTGAAGGSS